MPLSRAKIFSSIFIAFVLITSLVIASNSGYAFGQTNQQQQQPPIVIIARGSSEKIVAKAFNPDSLVVKNGSKITFINHDLPTHTAVSGNPEQGQTGQFDSGLIDPGKNVTITVKGEPGTTISYFCRIHTWMRGTIHIAEAQGAPPNVGNTTGAGQQQQLDQGQSSTEINSNNAAGNNSALRTFTLGGQMVSWASGSNATENVQFPYLISGPWALHVANGVAKSFDANITMVKADGTGYDTHRFTNFKVIDSNLAKTVILNSNSTATGNPNNTKVISPLELRGPQSDLSIPGKIDITTNGTKIWSGISASITISKWHAINIAIEQTATGNHFFEGHYAPGIFGVISSIKDVDGHELMQNDGRINLQK